MYGIPKVKTEVPWCKFGGCQGIAQRLVLRYSGPQVLMSFEKTAVLNFFISECHDSDRSCVPRKDPLFCRIAPHPHVNLSI